MIEEKKGIRAYLYAMPCILSRRLRTDLNIYEKKFT